MHQTFTHSKSITHDESTHRMHPTFSDNRFRFFTVIYRLKLACSFRSMEVIFGWSKTVLEEWYHEVMEILGAALHPFHEGLLLGICDKNWQRNKALAWIRHQEKNDTLHLYVNRINKHNKKKTIIPVGEEGKLLGCIGAVNCTYTVRPRLDGVLLDSSVNYMS